MVSIQGYSIKEELYNGSRNLVYRGIREHDQKPIVIKLLKNYYPDFNEILQFRNQYIIAKNLDIKGIVRPYALESYKNGYALVMEDFGGVSLLEYTQNHHQEKLYISSSVNIAPRILVSGGGDRVTDEYINQDYSISPQELQGIPKVVKSLENVLLIAVQIANILHNLHQHRVIHKDIKPANILINPQTKEIKLIDFSIASLLPKETQEIKNPHGLEGTLAYLSPEQTGRMNRGIDYRTDLYAFGVTLFELLVGELPFQSDDPMELVHCHIAKKPPSVNSYQLSVNSKYSRVVSDIVNKLMAKNPEDRYQSALGLKHDLETCLKQLQETGRIENFKIAQTDISNRFIIPEKLYGRETEIEQLLAVFNRVCHSESQDSKANQCGELMLITGFAGIGKTALVSSLHKSIVKHRGYFIKGKFDQFNRNIPFSAFVQAFRNLVRYLLIDTDENLSSWKNKILQALGNQGQVIIEIIPELEQIIGKQPSVPELSGTGAQNRFNLIFQKFIRIFTTVDHPLVIFLDDLQWADSASLKLMQLLLCDSHNGYLLIIGAYRDREVFPAHPLISVLDELKLAKITINTINLSPLSKASLTELVADILSCSIIKAQPLTDFVYQKTQGNPFFAIQFLKALHQDGLIYLNSPSGYWEYDLTGTHENFFRTKKSSWELLTKVREAGLADEIVNFMAVHLGRLSANTRNILELAACIGNEFDLKTLAIIWDKSTVDTADALWSGLQSGLILPQTQLYKFYLGGNDLDQGISNSENVRYRFLHDRVQQAAYSLIPEAQKQSTHLRIGRFLLQGLSEPERLERIFDIVNQFNLGRDAISKDLDKQKLARLNLQAAQKAKLSTAAIAVYRYCTIGIALLSANAWQTDYELIYSLYLYASEAAYLCGKFEQAQELYQQALTQAQTPLDKAVIYRVQMTQYQLQGRNTEAIAIQRQSLQLLGWEIPLELEQIQASLDEEISKVRRFLEQHDVDSILELPKMKDERIAETLRILQILFYSAWLDGQPTLAFLAIAKITTLSFQYGNSDMSPFGYVGYGVIANIILKDPQTAYQFGKMAVQFCKQFDNADIRGMTNFLFAADVHSWSRPIREADTYYENAYKYGMEAGNWLTVSFMMMQSGSDRLTYGKNLNELYAIAQKHVDFLTHINSFENLDALIVGVIQPIRNLLGLTKTQFTFDDENFNESEYLKKYSNNPYYLAWFYSVKIRHAYLFNNQEIYPDLIPKLSIIENTISTHAKIPSTVFYVALMHLALIENETEKSQVEFNLKALIPLEEKLNNWNKNCHKNIIHKCLLIQAEKARINRKIPEAIDLYEQAITAARINKYGYEEALANELAAKFYLGWGKEKVAAGYMQEAYYCYSTWGAAGKISDLEQRYPNLLDPIFPNLKKITAANISINSYTQVIDNPNPSINTVLDFDSILKASQSISSTIKLSELLEQITQVILQNSGGDYCALILPKPDGKWSVEAIRTQEETQLCSQPLENNPNLPTLLIQYVKNTGEVVVIDDLNTKLPIIDEYLLQQRPKSILCLPILNQRDLIGILYLKNSSTSNVFSENRIKILNLLCTQAAISLENARLYAQEQQKTREIALREAEFRKIFESVNDRLSICDLDKVNLQHPNELHLHLYKNFLEKISHRKQAEIALKNKTEELDRFFSLALDLLCIANIEGYFLRLNSQWENIFGYPLSKLQGTKFFDYIHPDDIEKTLDEFAQLKQGKKIFNLVNRYRCQDGSYRWIEWRAATPNNSLIYAAARDITKRKQSEDHLRELSVRLNLAVESAGMGIWDWDIKQNKLIWDKRMYKLYGRSPDQFSNAYEAWINSLHPDDRAAAKAYSQKCLQNENDYDTEFRVIHPDGSVRFIKANALVQRNSKGEAQRTIGINYDITYLKQAEAQLQQTNEELIRATRLKDEFLANMSHELRTPLNAILGMTEGLQEAVFGEVTQEQIKALETIERSGSHLLELINDILDVAKIESGQIKLELTSTAVVPLCNSSLAFIKQQALKKRIQVETNLALWLPDILIDERRIRQVLINLLINAVKFTTEGGRITLSVSLVQPPDTADSPPQTYLRIAVSDTGIGIGPENINKLFQPFIQIDSALNRQYAGTGLGLVLVKRIIELHGGRVGVSSEVGVGSCFTVDLPCTEKTPPTPKPETQSDPLINSHQTQLQVPPLILLAEDNEANISTVSSYLKAKGYRLVLAKNGREAVASAESENPDLILMDIQMPVMDGLEAIEQIRDNPNLVDVPIIALTALAMKGDRELCLEKGANDYISKPIKLKNLLYIIQQKLNSNNP